VPKAADAFSVYSESGNWDHLMAWNNNPDKSDDVSAASGFSAFPQHGKKTTAREDARTKKIAALKAKVTAEGKVEGRVRIESRDDGAGLPSMKKEKGKKKKRSKSTFHSKDGKVVGGAGKGASPPKSKKKGHGCVHQ